MGRRLLILGPPGAGKGTQATRLAAAIGVPHIATGDMLRAAVAAGTDLGLEAQKYMQAGELVPDDVVIGMLLDRVTMDDAACGYILDGFPRNEAQAQALDQALGERRPELALALEVEDDEVVRRISGRRSCPNGHVFHVEFHPPRQEGRCDECGAELVQRPDDAEEVVRNRLEVYRRQTAPLLGFYGERGLLRTTSGLGSLDEVLARLVAELVS